ncbi:transketolase family protein [Chthonomonas calidirosea]|uniref:transketolase family protein n=1 Tax=Chthonomonas calidirosea TaxID=454171 RepID=UPI0006EC6E57|nr:transketolase C-terminal domain-containing protein [Chthonomonas calidirosea]CEK19156.1 transketolase subunit B [Chthonomonas calidirosea]
MRTAFIEELCKLAEEEERIWLLCGDLGYSVLERFRDRFPNRYVNVGVAEQNMTGMAAGLALCGKIVFTYSIANFPVMRCLEQIRNDICYHHANVKIVAVGGGLAYGAQGYTHHGVEDLAVMRVLPEMTVIAPGDPVETRLATRAIVSYNGPCYLRLGKAGEPIVHQTDPKFEIGKAILMRDGSSVTLISTGGMLATVMQAAQRLAENGIAARVLSMHTLAPLDREAILAAAAETGGIVTVEEHGIGGLASAVAEVLAVAGYAVPFRALHLPRKPTSHAGTQESLRSVHGLSVEGIVTVARALT